MTISSFDLIISNFYKKNPYILVFDKSSILIFKDVIIFQYLLKLLSSDNISNKYLENNF